MQRIECIRIKQHTVAVIDRRLYELDEAKLLHDDGSLVEVSLRQAQRIARDNAELSPLRSAFNRHRYCLQHKALLEEINDYNFLYFNTLLTQNPALSLDAAADAAAGAFAARMAKHLPRKAYLRLVK